MLDGLLVGVIVSLALTASLFFVKFWRVARDQLFLAFAAVFAVEGLTRLYGLYSSEPTDRVPLIYAVRLVAYIFLIACIVIRNRKSRS
jgi:hypothetical protein